MEILVDGFETVGRLMVVLVLSHEEVEKRDVGRVEVSVVRSVRAVLFAWIGTVETEHQLDVPIFASFLDVGLEERVLYVPAT
jgi:hypothetical protein